MREILFRGKRTTDKKWVYGHYTPVCGAAPVILIDATMEDDCSVFFEYDHVDPATVGRYTGLTDKNGTRIFEGDIVEGADFDEDVGFGRVSWKDGAFWVGCDLFCGTFCENYRGNEFEVIGNIYEGK